MRKLFPIFAGIALMIMGVVACNLPSSNPSQQNPSTIMTAAALTVQAQIPPTVAFASPVATFTSIPPLPTAIPPTLPPPASPTPICDNAQFISENYPDNTNVAPGANFTKTWTFKNIGVCSWTPSYAIVFSNGDSMSGPAVQALPGNVNPGQTVDISVALTAPSANGTYKGVWKLRNAAGVVFVNQFWAQIKVAATSSGFDFHTRAASASWVGSAGAITFGGPDTDPNGFAMYRNGQRLEDGSTPAKVLEMHPQWVDNGVMTGIYQPYTITAGEHFLAKIGFLAKADGSCGVGDAIFQLSYSATGSPPWTGLGSWTKTCNGSLQNIDVNLNSLAGQNLRFALAVLANGSSGQDWAVWVSPRIEIP